MGAVEDAVETRGGGARQICEEPWKSDVASVSQPAARPAIGRRYSGP